MAFTLAILAHLAFESSAFVIGSGRHMRLTPRFSLQSDESNEDDTLQPDTLLPFLPAADPKYAVRGTVGDKNFVLDRCGGPTIAELTNENILKIVNIECSDLEVNTLVWKCLGYRFNAENEEWTPDKVFPKWLEKYPTPPDLIGMRRIYTKEIDQPSLKSNQSIVRSIPAEFKQSLKTHLKPLGFRGYKLADLTPNKTRRAQCANWLLYYREQLFGYTLEELTERRRLKLGAVSEAEKNSTEWKSPVTEVF